MNFDMYLDFCTAEDNAPKSIPPALQLLAAYHVIADPSYKITHPTMNNVFILILNVDGMGEMRVNEQCFSLAESQCILLSPKEAFRYRCSCEKWEFWWFEFDCENLGNVLEQMQLISFSFSFPIRELCQNSLNFLRQENLQLASSFFTTLLCLLSSRVKEKNENGATIYLCQKITRYIHSHLDTVSVSHLTWHFDIGERSLRNLFQQHLHISPLQYIQNIKNEQACYLLANTVKSISEIALFLGYTNQFNFSTMFKHKNGCSPYTYRKRQAGS